MEYLPNKILSGFLFSKKKLLLLIFACQLVVLCYLGARLWIRAGLRDYYPSNWYRDLQSTPLNTKALRENFPKLKEVTKRHSGPHRGRLDKMMLSYLPIFSTSAWRPHSPRGTLFTIAELQEIAKSTIRPGFLVPNIAHFVLPFGDTSLKFHHMVSLLSCLHVMKPHRILLWYAPGKLPTGPWWHRVRKNLSGTEWNKRIILVRRPIPKLTYSVPVRMKEHQSDVMRLEALLTFGGVYMDLDVLVLKPLEPLREFPFVIGREFPTGLSNAIFMSAPNDTFLAMWHTTYQVFFYSGGYWGAHSVLLPHKIYSIFPHLCHVEENSLVRPNYAPNELDLIYGVGQQHRWDWRRKNYAMHLWFRHKKEEHSIDSIKRLNSMYGEMCRFILFGIY